MSKKRRCVGCKGFFERESMYLQSAVQAFCTWDCFDKKNKKSKPKSNLSPRQIPIPLRRIIRRRDKFQCRLCLTTDHRKGRLALHHIVYRSEGGDNTKENLITLCHGCHDEVHSDKHRYQKKLLKMADLANAGKLVTFDSLEFDHVTP